MWRILMRKFFFDLKEFFFVNFRKNASEWQKILAKLYVTCSDDKTTFLT